MKGMAFQLQKKEKQKSKQKQNRNKPFGIIMTWKKMGKRKWNKNDESSLEQIDL